MIDRNDRVAEVLGASIEIQKTTNGTLPEGLWLLADRETKTNQLMYCAWKHGTLGIKDRNR